MTLLTREQAYAAMFRFLEELWERTGSDDLGGLLGGMSVLDDGSTADPAVEHDWQRAVEFALNDGKPGSLDLK